MKAISSGKKFITAWINLGHLPGGMMISSGGGFPAGEYGPIPATTSCIITTESTVVDEWQRLGTPFVEICLYKSEVPL